MQILLAYYRLPSVRTAGLLYFLIAGFLTQVPLFNYLGFEFSALMTVPAAFISGSLTMSFLNDHLAKPLTRRTYLFVVKDYLVVNVLLLAVPVVVISLNAIAVKNCSFVQGFMYFMLLPVCTTVFSVSLALVVRIFFRHYRMMFCALTVIILGSIVYVTYTEPQLFAYNLILGYFPGITYDETLNDIRTLVLYREFTLVAALLGIILFFLFVGMYHNEKSWNENRFLFTVRKGDPALYATGSLCILILIVGYFNNASLGFQYSAREIAENLGGQALTEHFILFYPRQKSSVRDVQRLQAEAEFHLRIVQQRLGETLPDRKKIAVYLYPNADTKRRFIGTATTNIAKPWRREIHITLDSFEETFRHELVHTMAGNFGLPIIRASSRIALNEGLATAIDWRWGDFSPHEYAAALRREGALENVGEMFSYTGFAIQQSSFAYVVAGSFSKYLIDRFGIAHFKRLFMSSEFYAVYGESLDVLVGEWKGFLQTIDASFLPSETVKTIFFQQSIFRKTCARVTAARNMKGVQAIRFRNFAEAESEFRASFEDTQTAFAFRGFLQSLIAQGRTQKAIQAYSELPHKSMLTYNPSVLLLVGDAYWISGDEVNALQFYHRVKTMNYSRAFTETAALRLMIAREPKLNKSLQSYFYGGLEDSLRMVVITSLGQKPQISLIAKYLMGRELVRQRDYLQAGRVLRGIVGSFEDEDLSLSCAVDAGDAFYFGGEFESAKAMYWQSKNYVSFDTLQQYIDERIERCEYVSEEIASRSG